MITRKKYHTKKEKKYHIKTLTFINQLIYNQNIDNLIYKFGIHQFILQLGIHLRAKP